MHSEEMKSRPPAPSFVRSSSVQFRWTMLARFCSLRRLCGRNVFFPSALFAAGSGPRPFSFGSRIFKFTDEEREKWADLRRWIDTFDVVQIPTEHLGIRYVRGSSGPGGQNVNKVATRVEIRFKLFEAGWLHDELKPQLLKRHPKRVNKAGEFVLSCDKFRSQAQNLREAVHRLYRIIIDAADIPTETAQSKIERMKRIQKESNEKRLYSKKLQSKKKRFRRGLDEEH